MLSLDKKISKKCNEAIIISGGARSGTTIIGKVLHSLKNVEYAFEPPALFALFPLINDLPKKIWKLLYEAYLYEDFLMNTLAGRNINCNMHDDSSIYMVKSNSLIQNRLAKSWQKNDLEKFAKSSQIIYKIPDICPYIINLQKLYPKTRAIITIRNANDTFHSIKNKAWFTDHSLKNTNQLWPNTSYKGFKIPYFVKQKDHELYIKSTEIERIAYYYISSNNFIPKIKRTNFVHYEELVSKPEVEINKIIGKLNLKKGEKTDEIIKSINLRNENRSQDLVGQLKTITKNKVKTLEKKLNRL